MNHNVDFDGTLYFNLINVWSRVSATWLTQMIKLSLHKNGNDSGKFRYEAKTNAVVADCPHDLDILQWFFLFVLVGFSGHEKQWETCIH